MQLGPASKVTLIDVGSMGEEVTETDIQRFESSLQRFDAFQGSFSSACMQALKSGYNKKTLPDP